MAIATLNPATGEVLKTFTPLSDAELEAKLTAAATTFETYRHTSFEQRATWLRAAAAILERDREAYGQLITLEMGKPLKAAIAEVEKCALVCRFYADEAARMLADVPIATDASQSFVCYQPLGVILAVMPWNFPFWQVFRFAAPALMAGNVGLLKHASNVPQCALAIADILAAAGFPAGAFQTLLIGADRVAPLIADERIKAATLTGSEPAGASLAQAAGKNLKKTVLELGGSDPFIVMPSADLETAVATAVTARMINTGQSCIAAKRFIVAEAIADEFEQKLLAKYQTLKVGDPMLPETDLGPLATATILADLDRLVKACLQQGATALCGGQPYAQTHPDSPLAKGYFYPPTILTNLPVGCPAYDEEFFGPVALLFRVPDLDSAIGLANCSPYGLGASAWTQVPSEVERCLRELEAGSVFINGMVKSDPRLPFGGIKRSGYGRELSREGILEFVNIKTVWIR
ncbi:NAD-dependent succinate-semialdehyde dehydrogenase [Trichothermofontia sichuanensis B231]|uniref:NAD-dependent succinate-semialdehyde dehydrogenase n=1 Tax=Trichothermofontia sichuanensis TaxID=3045816 RepID=UPI0022459BE7|nr:NAD-dependent succinate-semialdehyde dehydrogenase [Trichothermofontia sichuanensis]UZQ54884.1 NAD-dependent succinate-semialdehyde dehydrogenase [Trichothermofontia sichuanensis B231]